MLTRDVGQDGCLDLRCRFRTKDLVDHGAMSADITLLRLTATTNAAALLAGDDVIEVITTFEQTNRHAAGPSGPAP